MGDSIRWYWMPFNGLTFCLLTHTLVCVRNAIRKLFLSYRQKRFSLVTDSSIFLISEQSKAEQSTGASLVNRTGSSRAGPSSAAAAVAHILIECVPIGKSSDQILPQTESQVEFNISNICVVKSYRDGTTRTNLSEVWNRIIFS